MKILVSACLLGENCKYNGKNNFSATVADFVRGHEVVTICPEAAAGLGTPRTPIEIVDGVLMDKSGKNVDAALRQTARRLAQELAEQDFDCAVLQPRSPTCGVNQVYDGTFSGTLIAGSGVFAAALKAAGVRVIDAQDLQEGM